MDNELSGIATGLTTAITKDGQTTITANLPMAGFKHTGVGDAANRTDYASEGQVQDGKLNWVAAGGTADALTAAYTIPLTALVDGQVCHVRASAANATATPTFAPSGLTAHTITKNGGQALVAGDIFGAGHELVLRYKLASTIWELLNPATVAAVAASLITGTLGVNHGGTGAATLAAHGVVLGNGTGAVAVTGAGTSGQVLTSNGAAADPTFQSLASSVVTVKTQILSGSGTYTPSTGMLYCLVRALGGGGGGGGTNGANACGGGGGSGGYAEKLYTATLLGATAAYVVGAAGAAGANTGATGGTGGNSTFTPAGAGAVLTCNGGVGGVGTTSGSANTVLGGVGGTASGGDTSVQGNTGGYAYGNASAGILAFTGYGANSPLGSGGDAITAVGANPTSANGGAAKGFGAGGSGGAGASKTGGAGTVGTITVIEFCSQ